MVTLATKTVQAIEDACKADQGATFRMWLGRVIGHMGDAYRPTEESHRSHMGASLLGQECGRAIWYGFRWTTKKQFEGRIIRLFNRGHLEEARFIAMLLSIGCQIYQQDENGNQYRISFADGHAGGSGDGVAVGIPDLAPGTPALTEFKTHSSKSFANLKAEGVRASKFEHYVQMNLYMRKMGLAVGLYLAVNKDNDEIYGEIITLDAIIADRFVERGEKLVWLEVPPEKINQSPGFFKCKFCDHRPVCHLKASPDRNCRTCEHSNPAPGGQWLCHKYGTISKADQYNGCQDYQKAGYYE